VPRRGGVLKQEERGGWGEDVCGRGGLGGRGTRVEGGGRVGGGGLGRAVVA